MKQTLASRLGRLGALVRLEIDLAMTPKDFDLRDDAPSVRKQGIPVPRSMQADADAITQLNRTHLLRAVETAQLRERLRAIITNWISSAEGKRRLLTLAALKRISDKRML